MLRSALRITVLLALPAALGAIQVAWASRTPNQATHYAPPTTQSAVTNEQVADEAGITLDEVARLAVDGGAVLIDARSPEEFAEGHIPGARNVPVRQAEKDVTLIANRFDLMTDIVLYCGSGKCEDSGRLYDIMTKLLEYPNVRLFRGGMEAWREQGYPIETGPER